MDLIAQALSMRAQVDHAKETAAEWRMPQGRRDAYMSGDVVKHDGHTWVCTFDTNIFEPPQGYELLE